MGRRFSRTCVVFAVLAGLAGACGDDDEGSQAATTVVDGPGTTTTGSGTETEDLVPVSVGVTATAAVAPVWLAELYGFFEEEGIDVEVISFRAGADIFTAGASGSLDLMTGGVEHPARLTEQGGGEWRNISGLLGTSAFSIVMSNELALEPGDFAALEGLTIGTPGVGRSAHLVLTALLREAGLDPEQDVNFLELPSGPPGIAAWGQGNYDVAIVNEPVTSGLTEGGQAQMFADLREGTFGPVSTFPQAVVMAETSFIQAERPTLERFVTAVCRAVERGAEEPEEAAGLLADAYAGDTDTDQDLLATGLIKHAPGWSVELPVEPIEAWLEILVDSGSLAGLPTYEDIVDPSFEPLWTC